MRRQRSSLTTEGGQTVTELTGMLAIVALIVGAIAVLNVPSAVASGIHTAVCTILNTPCGKAPAPPAAPPGGPVGQDPSAPTSGPPIGPGLPIPVLPYDGATVSLSGTIPAGNPESGGESGGSGSEQSGGSSAGGGTEP